MILRVQIYSIQGTPETGCKFSTCFCQSRLVHLVIKDAFVFLPSCRQLNAVREWSILHDVELSKVKNMRMKKSVRQCFIQQAMQFVFKIISKEYSYDDFHKLTLVLFVFLRSAEIFLIVYFIQRLLSNMFNSLDYARKVAWSEKCSRIDHFKTL